MSCGGTKECSIAHYVSGCPHIRKDAVYIGTQIETMLVGSNIAMCGSPYTTLQGISVHYKIYNVM